MREHVGAGATPRILRPHNGLWLTGAVAASALGITWFAWSGFLRGGGARHIDTAYWYIAARCWLRGESPYELHTFSQAWSQVFGHPAPASFVYPPSSALLFLPMGALGWRGARMYFDLLNVGATAVLFGCFAWLGGRRKNWEVLATGMALSLTSSGLLATVYTGQTSLVVAAGLALIYSGSRREQAAAVVAGIVIASIKPQLAAPMFAWVLVRGPQRRAAWLGLALVACSGVLLFRGLHPIVALRESLAINVGLPENSPTVQYGLGKALAALRLAPDVIRPLLILLGAAAVLVFPSLRSQPEDLDRVELLELSALLGVSFIFAPVHDYDLVMLAPLFPAAVFLGFRGIAVWPAAAIIWRPALLKTTLGLGAPELRTAVTLAVVSATAIALAQLRAADSARKGAAATA